MTRPWNDPRFDGLGEPVEVFRPFVGNVIAGFVVSALFLTGAVLCVVLPLHKIVRPPLGLGPTDLWFWVIVTLAVLLAGLMCFLGVYVAGLTISLIARSLEITVEGFRLRHRGSIESVRWSDVVRIREVVLYERPPILTPPFVLLLPKIASRSFWVVTETGKKYDIDGNSVWAIKRLGNLLREHAERLSVSWATVEEHDL